MFSPRVIMAVWIILTPLGAHAVEEYTDAEAALLPNWCEFHRKGSTSDPMVAAKLAAFKREGCGGQHHYCWGMATANRVLMPSTLGYPSLDRAKMTWEFEAAVGDLDYVIKHSKGTCSLIPDIHTKSGEWMTLVGRYDQAEKRFRKAIGVKNDFAPAYIGLSDLFEIREKPNDALAVLQAGIKANPQSTALKKKLSRLQQRIAQQPSP